MSETIEPKFSYEQKVVIIKGFYRGHIVQINLHSCSKKLFKRKFEHNYLAYINHYDRWFDEDNLASTEGDEK